MLKDVLKRRWKGLLLFLAVVGPGHHHLQRRQRRRRHRHLFHGRGPLRQQPALVAPPDHARPDHRPGDERPDGRRHGQGALRPHPGALRRQDHRLPAVRRRPDQLRQRHRRVRRRRLQPGDLPHLQVSSPCRSAPLLVWLLVVKGTYRSVEKVFLYACLFYVTYIVSGFLAKPDWGAIGRSLVRPSLDFSAGSAGHDHRPRRHDHRAVDAVLPPGVHRREEHRRQGLQALPAGRHRRQLRGDDRGRLHRPDLRGHAVQGRHPGRDRGRRGPGPQAAGRASYCSALFAFGLLNASLFAASILPLVDGLHRLRGHGLGERRQQEILRGPPVLRALFGARLPRARASSSSPASPSSGSCTSPRSSTASSCPSSSSSCSS